MNPKLVKGILDTIMLRLIEENGSIHGYKIISIIRRKYKVYLGPSTIYPALRKLESKGMITSSWDIKSNERPIRAYTLTAKGKTEMQISEFEIETIIEHKQVITE
jgi:PadR family transcriptional regulator PadR